MDVAVQVLAPEPSTSRDLAFEDCLERVGFDGTRQPERVDAPARLGARFPVWSEIVSGVVPVLLVIGGAPATARRFCRSRLPWKAHWQRREFIPKMRIHRKHPPNNLSIASCSGWFVVGDHAVEKRLSKRLVAGRIRHFYS